ncbi:MAG: hypothetical protein ACJ74O_04935 [Frankiaceae bacterium]
MRSPPEDSLAAGAAALASHRSGTTLDAGAAERLPGNERNRVWRVPVRGDASGPATVVVKAYVGDDARSHWARESAALAVLARTGVDGPALLAAVPDPPLVVMTDAGTGPCLADALLGTDPEAARSALLAWVDALADLHAATARAGAELRRELAARDPALAADGTPALLARAADDLAAHLPRLGVAPSDEALAELRGLREALAPLPGRAALTPTDACPDNNLLAGGRLVLLDYEGAEHRHVAWDAAYLRLPWPSCWCSWRLPADVAEEALERYRERLAPAMPYVATEQFDRDLATATVGWALVSTGWFLPRAFDDPPPDDPRIVAPRRQALLQHRLGLAAGLADRAPRALAELAGRCAAAMAGAWGERPLALAPAWRGRTVE